MLRITSWCHRMLKITIFYVDDDDEHGVGDVDVVDHQLVPPHADEENILYAILKVVIMVMRRW